MDNQRGGRAGHGDRPDLVFSRDPRPIEQYHRGLLGHGRLLLTLFVTSLKKGSRKYVVWLAAIVIATLALVWLWLQGGYRLGSAALGPSSLQSSQGITFRSPEFRFRFVHPANWV